jgi:hypothetical protein
MRLEGMTATTRSTGSGKVTLNGRAPSRMPMSPGLSSHISPHCWMRLTPLTCRLIR